MRRSWTGSCPKRGDDAVPHRFGSRSAGRDVDEGQIAGAPLDEGADRALVVVADEEVALPVAGHRPVLNLSRPLADEDHVLDLAARVAMAL